MAKRVFADGLLFVVGAAIAVAVLLPARGVAEVVVNELTRAAIGALFLLYGTRVSGGEARRALTRWRLHTLILSCTFVIFPMIGVLARPLMLSLVPPTLYTGLLFLCVVPSTTLSSIAFTSISRGSVTDAVIGASASNLLGIILTPTLVLLLLHGTGHVPMDLAVAKDISLQLLLPFLLGVLLQPLIGSWLSRHSRQMKPLERAALGLVVYTGFITGVGEHKATVSVWHIGVMILCCMGLFTVMLGTTVVLGALARLTREERITLLFCGTQKSIATGLPIALVMFHGQHIGLLLLPLFVYYQVQLIAGSRHAARYSSRRNNDCAAVQGCGPRY